MKPARGRLLLSVLVLLCSQAVVAAASELISRHEHDDDTPPDPTVPIDWILYAHIAIQMLTWGIMYPAGMVLGLTKSRWHVPVQTSATVLTFIGFQLGHHHGGRRFYHTAHATFATFCFYYLILQVCAGIFCKLHIYEESVRPYVAKGHSILGKIFPVISWIQIVFGFITAEGFCFDEPGDHLGQCLAHFIMGSAFQAYGIVLLISVRYGAEWLANKNWSQEYLDSWMIATWGVINTFTEHDFLHARGVWSHKDMQHTSLGVIWWAGGALGIWLGRNGKRTIMPALVIAITGFAMAAHGQSSMLATVVHQMFGATLVAAGLVKIVEIGFLASTSPQNDGRLAPFFHLHPLLLMLAGMTFQSATEEQLAWIMSIEMDHVTYILLIGSGVLIFYLFINLLLSLYDNSGLNASQDTNEALPFFSWDGLKAANRPGGLNDGYSAMQPPTPTVDRETEDHELSDAYWHEDISRNDQEQFRR